MTVHKNNVKRIGIEAFKSCLSLKKAVIKEGVKSIGNGAPIKEITIPQNVKSIGGGAFGECRGLKKITVPEGLDLSGTGIMEDEVEIVRY